MVAIMKIETERDVLDVSDHQPDAVTALPPIAKGSKEWWEREYRQLKAINDVRDAADAARAAELSARFYLSTKVAAYRADVPVSTASRWFNFAEIYGRRTAGGIELCVNDLIARRTHTGRHAKRLPASAR